jgi:hypothetical protein
MGAWGTGAFENDDALDLPIELDEDATAGVHLEILHSVAETSDSDYLDGDDGARAVAGAELVAAAAGHPAADLHAGARAWLEARRPKVDEAAAQLALLALRRVMGEESELHALWDETPDAEEWRRRIGHLEARLRRVAGG